MIRFIDMRAADVAGCRFAFWNTTTDRFITIQSYAWDTWEQFEEEHNEVGGLLGGDYPLERFKGLCPPWAFEPPAAEGVCYHCLNADHEPEECPLSIAEATRRAWAKPPMVAEAMPIITAKSKRDAAFAEAIKHIALLEPAMKREMGHRPLLMDRDDVSSNGEAVSLPELEAWFLAQGVRCRIATEPATLKRGVQLVFLEAELVR